MALPVTLILSTINVFPLSIYLQKFDLFDDHGVKEYFRDIIQSTEHKLFENQFTYLNLISEGNNTIAGGMIEIITNNYLKPSINNNINELMNNKKLMLLVLIFYLIQVARNYQF